jgi:copper transport protein
MTGFLAAKGWRTSATLALLLIGLALMLAPGRVSAHAFLDRSDPAANAVIPGPPAEVRLWFTEPLEPDYSSAELFDANGTKVTTPSSRIGDDPKQLILPLPEDLPTGTYTVQWRNVSTADGHPQSGYLPFTIGSEADVVIPASPEEVALSEPPAWLNTLGRWLSLLGLTAAVGALLCWRWVIQPSYRAVSNDRRMVMQRRARLLALSSIALALVGSGIALLVQVLAAGKALFPSEILAIIRDTNYGHIWMLRIGLLVALGIVASRPSVWRDPSPRGHRWFGLAIAALALVPYAMVSHAAAQPAGRIAAVTADWLHLAATSVWIGGLITLAAVLVLGTRGLPPEKRRTVYASAIPRFTTLAICSVIILALTGFYAAWLQVGNRAALQDTAYGQTLLVKLALLVPLLLLGGINQRVIGPRMQRSAAAGVQFGRTVTAEVILGIVVLVVVGLLTSLPTGREALIAQAKQSQFHFIDSGVHAVLRVSPATVGVNRYTVDLGLEEGDLPVGTEVLVRVSRDGDIEGERQIILSPVSGGPAGRFEAMGSELSVVGTWQLELLVRRPNQADWTVTTPIEVARTPPEARVPGSPPRFGGIAAGVGILLAGIAVVTAVVGVRRRKGNRFLAEVGAGMLIISVVTLAVTWIPQTASADLQNPVPMSAASVAAGQALYQNHCAVCHGINARGDGPMAASLNPKPADLHASHVDLHSDGDMYSWIKNGYPDSAMPGFGAKLSDEQIWQLVNYVRSLRNPVAGARPS